MKIEEIKGYLGTGVKAIFEVDNDLEEADVKILMGLNDDCGIFENDPYWFSEFKLILRPLSDLTKEIEVNGEKFVPLEKLSSFKSEYTEYLSEFKGDILDTRLEFCIVQKLYEWHFNIHGIEAIDINTL